MALNLIRFSSTRLAPRLALTSSLLARSMSQQTTPMLVIRGEYSLFKSHKLLINKASLGPLCSRHYASEGKLDKAKIEEKVLEVLRNFDRIKENPDKPKVVITADFYLNLN